MARADAVQARERRVIMGGIVVVAVAVVFSWLVLPFAREWSRRETAIRALRVEVDSLAGLVAARAALEAHAADREAELSASGRRVFHARSMTLAASALQALLTDAADAAHLVVTRLDVAPDERTTGAPSDSVGEGPTRSLPATLAAYCDVVGLAALLDQLARAPRVVEVERMTVQQNSALRGAADMLQVTLSLRAPVVIE